jgi:sterol desaturase/sphingolipid hydroxylase (fatty acid hydroxylase superfamily)
MWITYVSFVVVFLGWSTLHFFLDVYCPFVLQYKYIPQVTSNELVQIYKKVVPLTLFNLFVTHPFCYWCLFHFLQIEYNDFSFWNAVITIIIVTLIYDAIVLYIHTLLHHPTVFPWIHKKHHEMKVTVALGGLFMHPLEHILINIVPPFIGLMIMNIIFTHHIYTLTFLSMVGAYGACSSHCGYFSDHHKHHITYGPPFSALGIWEKKIVASKRKCQPQNIY